MLRFGDSAACLVCDWACKSIKTSVTKNLNSSRMLKLMRGFEISTQGQSYILYWYFRHNCPVWKPQKQMEGREAKQEEHNQMQRMKKGGKKK